MVGLTAWKGSQGSQVAGSSYSLKNIHHHDGMSRATTYNYQAPYNSHSYITVAFTIPCRSLTVYSGRMEPSWKLTKQDPPPLISM
jgi:hypothetical protein